MTQTFFSTWYCRVIVVVVSCAAHLSGLLFFLSFMQSYILFSLDPKQKKNNSKKFSVPNSIPLDFLKRIAHISNFFFLLSFPFLFGGEKNTFFVIPFIVFS